ncbi:MAG: response regulator [Acutalibacteraceae bacterium]
MIEMIIVDDNLYVQTHFSNLFEKDPRFHIAGIYRDAFEAEKACRKNKIDLVLMDVQTLHNHSGLAAGKRIKESCPDTKVIVVTSLVDPDVLAQARRGCADSLWYKDHGDEDIMKVIDKTLAGGHSFPDTSPEVEMKDALSSKLSPRQIEILRRYVHGMTYDEIAAELKLTNVGVRWNLDKMVETCGYKNKHELLAAAIESKLIVTSLEE